MTVAVCIPAHAPRLEELIGCLTTMTHHMLHFVVVTNEPTPIERGDLCTVQPTNVTVLNTGSEEINLSKWWNIGLEWARQNGHDTFMVTESDVRMRPEAVWHLHAALWHYDFSMVGPNLYGRMKPVEISVETRQDGWGSRHPGHRICQTWMVKTAYAVPADERFAWWHSDEQHEMVHRGRRGGTAIVGASVYERDLFQTTQPDEIPVLSEANRLAKETFRREWGFPTLT